MRPVIRRFWPLLASLPLTLAALALFAAPALFAVRSIAPYDPSGIPWVSPPAPHRPHRSLAPANPFALFASARYTQTAVWSPALTNSVAGPIQPVDVAMVDETHLFVADAGNRAVWLLDRSNGTRERFEFDMKGVDPCSVAPIAVSVQRAAKKLLVLWVIGNPNGSPVPAQTVLQVRTLAGVLERQLEVPEATDIGWHEASGDVFLLRRTSITRLRWPDLAEIRTYAGWSKGAAGQLALTPRWIAVALNNTIELSTLDTGRSAGSLNLGTNMAMSVAADPAGRLFVLVRPRTSPGLVTPGPTPLPTATPTPPPDGTPLVMVFDADGALVRTFSAEDLNTPPLPQVWWPFTLDLFASPQSGGAMPARPALALISAEERVGVYAVPPCDVGDCRNGTLVMQGAVPPAPPQSFSIRFGCGQALNTRFIIAALPDGGLLAYHGRRSQIVRFRPDGLAERVGTIGVGLEAMATDGKDAIFGIVDQTARVTTTTVARFELPLAPGDPLIPTWQQDCACEPGGSLASDGHYVYLGQPLDKQVAILNAFDLSIAGELRLPDKVGLWPSDVATTPDGWVWAADLLAGQVEGWAPVSRQPDERWPAGLLASPWHLAGGALDDGLDIIAAYMTDGTVELHGAADGNLLARWDPHAYGERYSVGSLAIGKGGRVYLADDTNGMVHVFEPRLLPDLPTPESPTPSPTPSRRTCLVQGDKVAAPGQVVLGDTARITLTLAADCPAQQHETGADVVLVMDRSGSMTGQKLSDAQAAAKAFVQFLDVRVHRVGLVSFNSTAVVVTPLTNNPAAVINGLNSLKAQDGTNIAAGLTAADDHLLQAGRPDALPVIVLLSDGQSAIQPALDAAFAARGRGVRIYTIGLGPDVNHTVMLQVSSGRYFPAPTSSELFPIYREIVRLVTLSLSGNLLIDDQMAPAIQFVAGSTVPKAFEGSDTLHWGRSILSPGGITLTYQILPLRAGRLPTNQQAVATYTDADGVPRSYTFPVPVIEVITPTPTPTPTSTPTPTPTPTSTPTPTPRPAYLPLAANEKCTPAQRRVDVVLVLDASTSMAEPAGGGAPGSKLDAARAAARAFLGQLQFGAGDQAALVTFNNEARLLQALTGRSSDLDRALGAIILATQTRLQRGIEMATSELQSPRHRAANAKVIILLTDGRANPEPVSQAVDRATAAKAGGIILFTVGLGRDLDREALAEMASLRSFYFEVLDASTLTGIFVRIAGQIPCSASQFWGRR